MPLSKSLVRIRAGNIAVGVGFLVSDRLVVTCAHVIAATLGKHETPSENPKVAVSLDFHLLAPNIELTAQIVFWLPPAPDEGGDIALLELERTPPDGVQAIQLVTTDDLWKHSFRAYGFPLGNEKGEWVSGELFGQNSVGWIQIESTSGYRVQLGFSGGPVWDDQIGGAVGMVVASDEGRSSAKTAFIIPSQVLVQALPTNAGIKIRKASQSPDRLSELTSLLSIPDTGVFFDRQATLEETLERLKRHRFVVVQGLAGVGKTSLVARLAHNTEHEYGRSTWIKCTESVNFDYILLILGALLAQFGETKFLDTALSWAKLCTVNELAASLLEKLRDNKILLVFDSFDNAINRKGYISDNRLQQLFETLLESRYDSRVIVTTRLVPKFLRRYDGNYGVVDLKGLGKKESFELVQNIGNMTLSSDTLAQLYQSVHGHPFALKIFASITAFYPAEVLLADKQLFLDECGVNLLDKLFKTMRSGDVDWVKRLSVLRRPFSVETFTGVGGDLATLDILRTRFLLDYDAKIAAYNMHPLVRDFAYTRTTHKLQREYHANAANYFSSKISLNRITIANFGHAIEASYHYSRAGDLKSTIAIPIGFTESLHYLGLILFKQRDYSQAEKCYSAILQIDGHDDKAHFYYAASLDLQGPDKRHRVKDIIEEHYLQSLEVRPRSTQYLDYYAYFLANIGRRKEAGEFFEKGVQLSANCPTLYRRYGLLLEEFGEVQHAEEVFSLGCKRAYNSEQLLFEYAKLKAHLGQKEKAKEILQQGLLKYPKHPLLSNALKKLDEGNWSD